MAKSSTPRRSLKSLFSKKEDSHDDSVEKSVDKNEGQKKRFQFLKFKSKPKTDPGPVKAVHGSQQLLSAAEPSNSAEDGGTWVDNIASDNKKLSLYGTSPRSKASILPSSSQAKALSYSELDLRKPKRIASFSFGFRRKKKNDIEENISKSTTVLDSPGLEEPKEPPLLLSQVKLDETDMKTTFSMSQPVLVTSDKFDNPSPPPVATNQSESYFTISKQSESNVDINIHREAKEPLTNGSNLSAVREELQKAPIATIPELQLDNLESLEENKNIPVYENSNPSEPTTLTKMTFAVNDQSEPILSDSQPLIVPDTSNDKVAVAESVSLSNGPCDNDILQQSHKTTEISLTETNRDALSYHQPDAPDTADSTAQNVELSLASVDSKIDTTIMESTPVPHADKSTLSADSASVHQEVSISRTEGSTPETATTVTATSTVRKEKSTQPVTQTAIYGELYDSLLPQSLILEVVSSISNPPSQIRTETRHLSTRSEPILVKSLNEHHTETDVIYSHLSTSRELYSSPGKMSNATGGYTNNNATFSESKLIPATSRFMSNETSTAFQPQRNTDIYSRYLTSPLNSAYKPADSGNIPHSTLTRSLSEVKSDSVSLIQDNVSSVSVVQSPAPPASDDVMSQEGDAQVTDSKRRAILVKELVTEEVSSDPVCPTSAPEKMSATEGLEIKIEKRESFSAHSGLTSGSDRALSPAYPSMGSDDGSATEIYYSAEEDNAEEYTVDERKESHVVDVVKEAGLREQIPQKEEIAESRIKNREEGEFRVVIVKTQSEEDIIGKEQEKVDLNSRFEVQQQVRGQRSEDKVPQIVTSRFLVGSDAKSQEKEVAATVLPQVKENRKETKEKLPATLDNTEKSKDVEVYKVDERKESHVADVVKETRLREEIPQKEDIAESGIRKREEGEFRVVIVKTQSEEGKIGNEEEKLDLNSRTDVQQQVRGQSSEDKVPRIITSRFLVGNDAKSQEKEEAVTVSPQVKEDRKEETKEELPTTLDNAEKSKDVEVYKVDERKESHMADVVKETRLREEIPQKEDIAESGIRKTEEGEFRVVIVKTQSEEGKIGNEEEKLDLNSRTDVQQQVRGQRSEDKVPRIITSRFLVGNDAKSQEKEEAATVSPQVKEDRKEETKEELPTTLDNAEKSKDVEVYKVDERKESHMADVVKETRLPEEICQKEDIAESGIRKREEAEFKVVIAKTQSEEGKIGNEVKLHLNSRTDVQQQVRSQRSEDKVPQIITSRFLVGNDAKSQEKEAAATVLPKVKENRKGETKEELPTTLDTAEKSKDVEVYKVDERKESHVADVVKETRLLEEIRQKEDIAESGIRKTEEGEFKVVIAETQSEEGKLGNKEEKYDLNSRTEVQQQVRGQKTEDKVPQIITSRFLVGSDAWSQEKEVAATVLPQVKEDKKEERKEKLPATLDNTEKSKDVEVYKVDERKEGRVADVVKEAGLREEIPQKEDIAESRIRKTEDKVPRIITSRFLVGSDEWSHEKEEAATVLPKVKEDKKEETKEKLSATLDNAEKSKDVKVYKVDERKESHVADVVKETRLREEIPQKEDIAESGIKKIEEGEFKVAIAKTQSEEGKLGKEEEKVDLNSRTEVQQQVRGQRSEDKVPRIITSRFLVGSDEWSQEKEVAATVLPQVKEDKKEETKEKLPATLDNAEKSKDVKVYKVDERKESHVADVVKEAGLREEIPQKEDIAESGIKKTEEGEFKVAIAKTQSEEGKLGKNEEKLDLNSRTEVQQQVRSHRSEDKVPRIITSRFLVGSDAWSQEKEVAATVLPRVKGEREEEKKEELPATPVQQVNTVMVCDFAPPSSKPHGQREGSEGNWTAELETEDPPNGEKQLPSQRTQYLSHKDTVISEYMHAVSSHTRKEDTITPRLREAEEQVSLTAQADKIGEESKDSTGISSVTTASAVTDTSAGVKVVTGTLTHSTELQSDATETEHNRAPQSSEWVDTITQSTDRTRTVQEQVAVELSTPNVDTQCPDNKAAESLSERHQHPAEAQPDLNQGSLTASRTLTAASEVLASESQPTEADKELVEEMNSGYSSLSTKLSLKTSSPLKEDESKNRFRKVSLVNETNTTEVCEDAVDVSKTSTTVTESNGTDTSSDFKWKNRFEGVSQYKPYKTEFPSFTDSLSYRVSDTDTSPSLSSSSSALPEATAYKHLSNAYSSPSSSPAPDEHTTLGNRLSDRTTVYLRYESEPAEAPKDEWRRSLVEQEEPAAPAAEREGQRERGGESERIKSHWDSHELPVSSLSSAQQTNHDFVDSFKKEDNDDSSRFTGVFTATLVELVSEPAAPPSTPPGTPEEDSPSQFDMDSLVDTLKSMGPSLRPRNIGPRAPAPVLISSLPPIVEDAPSPITADIPGLLSPTKKMEAINNPAESLKGLYTLPADLGLKRSSNRDTRSPLELMKQSQQDLPQPGTRGLNLPQRASATNSIVMRKSSDSSPEELKSPVLNGNGLLPSSTTGSRLDSSVIFGSHRSASIDQPLENGKAHRSLFRTSSLPETGPLKDRMSIGPKELGDQSTEPAGSRFDRFSFLLNSSPSASSLTGSEDSTRISRPPLLGMGSPPSSNSPTRLLSPTGSIDLQRPFTTTDSPLSVFGQTQGLGMGMGVGAGVLSPPILQRSFSNEGIAGVQQTPLFNSLHGVSPFQSQEVETERTLAVKYRAFPDAYLTKEKEHGKLNPRPGKMYVFDRPGMCGQRIEIRSDVIDATSWELQETISIRVVRGGWVMYEKPNFKGEKIALDEGDIELTYPFSPPEEQLQNGQEGEKQNGEATDAQAETKPARRFIIGSLRRAVRDYSVPEISLFPEENAEGKKVIFRDTSEDARIFGFPVKANSIIINAGLWLVYAHPFFQGVPRVLEVGGYSNPAAWGVEQPYVGSLHPLKVGEPRVENTSEPKMVIYDKPYFSGKSRTITTNMRDFITRVDRQQTAFMYNVGSLKVLGGIWVGYEKEGFRGHQYLLEEGEYQDWRVWGGNDAELRSTRVIRADLTDPMMVMFEQPEEDQEGMSGENTFEVTEAIPDVELFGYKTYTRSIHVLSGAWIAYSHVDFSGNQYILEKGFYNNCADWGSQDTRICSVQPILLAPGDNARSRNEIILYSEPDFQGECHVFDRNQEATPEKLLTKSCRVSGGSWVVYENKQYSGNLYVLSEGDYPSLTSMGCLSDTVIRSVKVVPMKFSVPSISLFGLECLEGREITTDTEIPSMVEEGFNNHILSVRVNSGCWVICEHSNYRGRQFLLEQIEITNWPKFSSLQTIGSMFPVRQKRRYFRIKSKERGHFMSVQGGVEEMKSGRVVVAPEVEPMSDIWFYQDGFIKSKLAQNMSLQVMGNIEPGAKVVLWTETRQPIQTWAAQMSGLITSLTFPGCVLDVKGGKTYDKDHVVMMPENEERPSQQWEIELL